MGYPFYHIKRCRKAAPTVRHTKIIKNHQIGPHNWKKVKNYENKQSYTAKALGLQLLLIILIINWNKSQYLCLRMPHPKAQWPTTITNK